MKALLESNLVSLDRVVKAQPLLETTSAAEGPTMPPGYLIVTMRITDPERYRQYMAEAQVAVAAAGGEYLARGGRHEVLEGDVAPRPGGGRSLPELRGGPGLHRDPATYGAISKLRADATEYFDMVLVEGLDARPERGTARMNEPSSKQGVTRP